MAITILVGVLSHGNIAYVSIYGLGGGLLFGAGGVVIGNLIHGYVIASAMKEAERLAIERELAKKMAEQARQQAGKTPAKAT
jgi:hypothetical protein